MEIKEEKNCPDILVIEDNKADLFLIENILSSEFSGKLNSVPDGEEALSYLKKEKLYQNCSTPNLIILDLNIPKVSGKELLAKLKNDINLRIIPVIIFSSSQNQSDIEDCYNLGANCYMVKPFTLEDYEDVLKTVKKHWTQVAILP
jgi:CheY-like chemotaxis protein